MAIANCFIEHLKICKRDILKNRTQSQYFVIQRLYRLISTMSIKKGIYAAIKLLNIVLFAILRFY